MDTALKPSELIEALKACIATNTPAFVYGAPGIGKTSIISDLANTLASRLIVKVAATMDAVDLSLVKLADATSITHTTTIADWLYNACDGEPTIVFFDELPNAPGMVHNSLQKLINERELNGFKIPNSVSFIAAGNRVEHRAGANRMHTAMATRFTQYTLEPDYQEWCAWAVKAGIEPIFIAFVRTFPTLLSDFNPKADASPSPRAYERLSNIWKQTISKKVKQASAVGWLGEGAAIQLLAYDQMFQDLGHLNPDAILLNPETIEVPNKPDALYAVSTALAARATRDNFARVKKYLDRLPAEYSVMAMKDAIARDKTITQTTEYTTWIVKHHELAAA